MGNLLKVTPYSEITATMEVLASYGVEREHLDRIRSDGGFAKELAEIIKKTTSTLLAETTNPFAKEVISSSYKYSSKYAPKTVAEQVEILQKIYKDLGLDASHVEEIVKGMALPKGSELFQVIPKLSAIAKAKGIEDPYGEGYGECLEVMLSAISASRKFYNYRKGELTKKHVQLLASSKAVLMKLEAETLGDYIITPMQSGLLYKGSSARRSRWEIEHSENQWALPSWVVGHHLLTHPERLTSNGDLFIDCTGDEYSPGADGSFADCLYFRFSNGRLEFRFRWFGGVSGQWGAGSGFLPECSKS